MSNEEGRSAALPPAAFARADADSDAIFYSMPRFVTHIDAAAVATVTALYRELFPDGGTLLDLMSSWVSHLPADVHYARVVGHGMNAEELDANPQLNAHFVQDLNEAPALPFPDGTFDGAAICVSIQYLTRPYEVMRELGRVLKAGAPLAITMSNRCFPAKAVNVWLALDMWGHRQLVRHYLEASGAYSKIYDRVLIPEGAGTDPLDAIIGHAGGEEAEVQP